jgi:hypothetical protein
MQLLGQIVRFSKELLALKGQVDKNTLEIKEIREDLKQLTIVIQNLKHEMEVHQLKQDHELKLQRLELENTLLRHFSRLRPMTLLPCSLQASKSCFGKSEVLTPYLCGSATFEQSHSPDSPPQIH